MDLRFRWPIFNFQIIKSCGKHLSSVYTNSLDVQIWGAMQARASCSTLVVVELTSIICIDFSFLIDLRQCYFLIVFWISNLWSSSPFNQLDYAIIRPFSFLLDEASWLAIFISWCNIMANDRMKCKLWLPKWLMGFSFIYRIHELFC